MAEQRKCPGCNVEMVKKPYRSHSLGLVWRCPVNTCRKTIGFSKDSVFENSRLAIEKCLKLILEFSLSHPVLEAAKSCEVNKNTAVSWHKVLRDVCAFVFCADDAKLGGKGKIVEIDESLIAKRKYHRGRLIPQRWVLGFWERETSRGFCTYVPSRNAETLISIIQRWVAPGTTIMTDQWGAYNSLSPCGYDHRTVNHSQNFVSPEGNHTQGIEGFWSKIKLELRLVVGSKGDLLWDHVEQASFDKWYFQKDHSQQQWFEFILGCISERYPFD